MRFGELRDKIRSNVVIHLITKEQEEDCRRLKKYIALQENYHMTTDYNELEVVEFYNDRFPSICASGITVVVKRPEK